MPEQHNRNRNPAQRKVEHHQGVNLLQRAAQRGPILPGSGLARAAERCIVNVCKDRHHHQADAQHRMPAHGGLGETDLQHDDQSRNQNHRDAEPDEREEALQCRQHELRAHRRLKQGESGGPHGKQNERHTTHPDDRGDKM